MQIETFWKLLKKFRDKSDNNCWYLSSLLEEELETWDVSDIIDFDNIIDSLLGISYRNDLWAAAYIINSGCSDDGFLYFRAWLIAQGQQVFYSALENPDTLAELDFDTEESVECEQLLYIASHVYKAKTGTEMPDYSTTHPELIGEDWTEDDLEVMFPKLSARF